MPKTIKEQIIEKICDRVGTILTGAYSLTVNTVRRGESRAQADQLPIGFVFPQVMEEPEKRYQSKTEFELPVKVELMDLYGSNASPDVKACQMEADLIECFFGPEWSISFTSGTLLSGTDSSIILGKEGTALVGDIFYIVRGWTLTSGDWLTGDATGTLNAIRLTGSYSAPITNDLGGVASINATSAPSRKNMVTEIFDDLILELIYDSSGVASYPLPDDTVVSTEINLIVRYKTKYGNPYA